MLKAKNPLACFPELTALAGLAIGAFKQPQWIDGRAPGPARCALRQSQPVPVQAFVISSQGTPVHADNAGFALLVGIPLFAIACVVTLIVGAVLGPIAAWVFAVAAVAGWPIYYIAMTRGDTAFREGLPLLLFTVPPIALGCLASLIFISKRSAA